MPLSGLRRSLGPTPYSEPFPRVGEILQKGLVGIGGENSPVSLSAIWPHPGRVGSQAQCPRWRRARRLLSSGMRGSRRGCGLGPDGNLFSPGQGRGGERDDGGKDSLLPIATR